MVNQDIYKIQAIKLQFKVEFLKNKIKNFENL